MTPTGARMLRVLLEAEGLPEVEAELERVRAECKATGSGGTVDASVPRPGPCSESGRAHVQNAGSTPASPTNNSAPFMCRDCGVTGATPGIYHLWWCPSVKHR